MLFLWLISMTLRRGLVGSVVVLNGSVPKIDGGRDVGEKTSFVSFFTRYHTSVTFSHGPGMSTSTSTLRPVSSSPGRLDGIGGFSHFHSLSARSIYARCSARYDLLMRSYASLAAFSCSSAKGISIWSW